MKGNVAEAGGAGLTVSGVRVALGSRWVLDGVDLKAPPSCSVAVVGPSGSGKTTLLAVIGGLVAPCSGVVHYAGAAVDRRETAWVMQTTPLLGGRSAQSNVALGALHRGRPRGRAVEDANALLADLGLETRASTLVRRLSGGERQRVAVARALAQRASVVIADEPTASLDAGARDGVVDALLAVEELGRLVVVATHDMAVAQRCSRVLELVDGRLR